MLLGSNDPVIQKQMADYLNRPVLPEHLAVYFEAFSDISNDRDDGGPIPFVAIDRCAARCGVNRTEEFQRFKVLIKALDGAWLEVSADLRAKMKAQKAT